MKNEHDQLICEGCSLIVNDQVTITPGYLEVTKSGIVEHFSSDPNNGATFSNGLANIAIIKNRLKNEQTGEVYLIKGTLIIDDVNLPKKGELHFCGVNCLIGTLGK